MSNDGIKKLREDYMKVQDAEDVEGALSFWADDGALMPPSEPPVVGKDALRAFYQEAFGKIKIHAKFTYDWIETSGELGYARGGYEAAFSLKDSGESFEDTGKFLDIVRRQSDGTWRFVCHTWSSNSSH